jgi:hypothetical protein
MKYRLLACLVNNSHSLYSRVRYCSRFLSSSYKKGLAAQQPPYHKSFCPSRNRRKPNGVTRLLSPTFCARTTSRYGLGRRSRMLLVVVITAQYILFPCVYSVGKIGPFSSWKSGTRCSVVHSIGQQTIVEYRVYSIFGIISKYKLGYQAITAQHCEL